ncbi:MAG: sugar nucleotide-binding protein [Elusimicrobiales bacterium]
MRKITIIGSGGMAGHVVSLYLSGTGRYALQNISHSTKLSPDWLQADVEDTRSVAAALAAHSPEVVINCVGTLVRESQEKPGAAAFVNGYFPHFLEELGLRQGFRLLHLSTDCVFSGAKGSYAEGDARDGKDFYAQSKAMGEVINARDLTIRTSIVGPEIKKNGTGLFHWLMTSRGTVKGFGRAFWNGVTTLELARAIDAFIGAGTSGLCHLASPGRISKHDLITLMRDTWGRREPAITREAGAAVDKTLVCTRADLPYKPRDYSVQMAELREWVYAHKELYAPYL